MKEETPSSSVILALDAKCKWVVQIELWGTAIIITEERAVKEEQHMLVGGMKRAI